MKGYKALDKNMRTAYGDGMQYELGKTYEIPKETVNIFAKGYHFYKDLDNIFDQYPIDSRVFEIESPGIMNIYGNKCVTNKITLVRELSREELLNHFRNNISTIGLDPKLFLTKYGDDKDLDILVHDDYWLVRREVAIRGRSQDLDALIQDENPEVRAEVAKHGRSQDLDILVHDENWLVRQNVVKHGRPQDLDILVLDKDDYVRATVARYGRPQDLEILMHDEIKEIAGIAIRKFIGGI